MGVQEEDFNNSIVSFGGADKRLESLLETDDRAFLKILLTPLAKLVQQLML